MAGDACCVCNNSDVIDPVVTCAICFQMVHAKCIGMKGKDVDKFINVPGLRYFCKNHVDISPDALIWKISKLQKLFGKMADCFSEASEIFKFDAKHSSIFLDGFSRFQGIIDSEIGNALQPNNRDGLVPIVNLDPMQVKRNLPTQQSRGRVLRSNTKTAVKVVRGHGLSAITD